jgi:hypothetical protein
MYLFNYTSLKTRDTKIYNIGGTGIAGGLSIEFLKVVAPMAIVGILVGTILGLPFRINFFNPFSENFHAWWTIMWLVLGIGSGLGLWYIQFAGYRLYEYLIAYLKPKKVYMNDWKHTEVQLTTIQINAMVKHLL